MTGLPTCTQCGGPAALDDTSLCAECAIAAAMAPEPEDIPDEDRFCGECGSEDLGDKPVIRASFREGGPAWVRCTSCTTRWRAERGEQERREKALRASKLPYKSWRWIRSQYDSRCLFCAQPILTGEKVRYAAKLGVVHGGCRYSEQLRLVADDGENEAA